MALVAIATALAAAIYIGKKLFKAAQALALLGELLPVLKDFTAAFKDNPSVFQVLNQIAAQFRTDSGSSLRDVVDRLEAAAKKSAVLGGELSVDREVERRLSIQDREQLARLLNELARLGVKVEAGAATGLRNEEAARVVASDLAHKVIK